MIIPMSRMVVVSRKSDKDRLLRELGVMGILHVEAVNPEEAVPDEAKRQDLADLDRAIQILDTVVSQKDAQLLQQDPMVTALEVIGLYSEMRENNSRLNALYREAGQLKMWGDVRIADIETLRDAGLSIQVFSVPNEQMDEIEAECVAPLAPLADDHWLVAVVDRKSALSMPDGAEAVPLPPRDRPSLLKEAAALDEAIKFGSERLSVLATQTVALKNERHNRQRHMAYEVTERSGLLTEDLFALQGWMPSEMAENVSSHLRKQRIPAAIRIREARPEESPPTEIQYPAWTRPIKAMFDLLGTLPGYREMDLSPVFMIALPIFAAMLIGDAGYGFLLALAGGLFYKRMVRAAGSEQAQLIIIFGVATFVWGVLTANYFGITPETLAQAGGSFKAADGGAPGVDYPALWSGTGFYARSAQIMRTVAPLWRPDPEVYRFLIIKVSLIIGCVHLVTAHFQRFLALFPDRRAYAEAGWMLALVDMLILIWHLLFVGVDQVPVWVWWVLLGALLFPVWFGRPEERLHRRILLGFSTTLLPMINTFSDTMSYLRLFAVGMASYYIAVAFNVLGARLAEVATWVSAVPVLLIGHGLNIGLAGIAIFAHGVRLNMLEFSNNARVQWRGYAYRPYVVSEGPSSAGRSSNFVRENGS